MEGQDLPLKARLLATAIGWSGWAELFLEFTDGGDDQGVHVPVSYTHLTLPTNREV